MTKIFKNMAPYWYMIVAIVLLLIVQAFGDLSLPQYTSDIIDVGIQNKGVEHILPVKMMEDEYEISQLYMTSKEKKVWKDTYEKKGEYYICKVEDEEKLDQLDDTFLTAIFLNHNMSNVKESQFKKMIKNSIASNPAMAPMKDKIDDMSVDEIGKMLNMEFKSFQEEDDNGKKVTYVDVRPMLYQMRQTGMMSAKDIQKSREEIEKKMNDIGESTLFSTGVAYATKCDKAAGVDIDKIQTDYLWKEGGRMLGIAFMILVAAIGVGFLASKVGASIGRDLRGKIYKKVMGFSNAEMNRFSTASLITRSTNDIQQIQMVTAVMLRLLLYAPIIGIGGIIKVYQTGAGMEWIIALAVVVILGFVMLLVSMAMPKFKIMQTLVDGLNLVSREILTGLSVIRAFGREKTEEERFDEANKKLTGTQLFTNRIMTFMMPGMMFIMYSVTILITWVSAQKIDAGTLQVGAMTAFITYAMQIVMAFLMMTAMSIMVPRAGVAADRIDEVLKTEASVQDVKKPETLKEHKGVLEFSHVDFKYPGAEYNVLSDIDFKVEPGKTTAIIGSTGCGKSTLVNLIPRFYDVTGGQITLDGKDIRRISMEELREEIGFVPQKGVLFSGTIASNLRFGKADATDEDIKEAAEIAQATEFIETKKEKYDSPIAQGGSNVSGGQKQRLAIARAIAKKAKVLVFDDSFSALDMKTDAALRKELNEKVQDASIVIVAQRVSTILHADQILVLDDGKIVGKGTHEELLKNCEVYLQIAKSQLSEKELGLEKLGLVKEKAEKETNKKEILSTKIDEKENNKLKKKSDDRKLKHKKGGK
ncbi:ABC transporter ATP-binding protein [Anaerobutyricum soehngenii]|uniref:ABC transporter ATP-binding protein n=1 Tax=Anaerobutyricum soehngenii TaxID=105843 RepID=A0A6N7YDZ7_9FIRM|nr:ABC transporter ATP-binding protein [Anaerobutyricum soehngenii]MSU81784.1 ABC transporter ATP-binding protein [Anaerobutyricum soehngenii]